MTFQQERLAQILKRSHTSFTCKSLLDPPAQPTPVLEGKDEGGLKSGVVPMLTQLTPVSVGPMLLSGLGG